MRWTTSKFAMPPTEATCVVIDLRNFTPNLNAAGCDASGVNTFCHFLAGFYAECLDACLCALHGSQREAPPLAIRSTGDGMLIVFDDPQWHVGHGFLATLLLHRKLMVLCESYNTKRQGSKLPLTGFGIGVESGEIFRVAAEVGNPKGYPVVSTYIGECINVAARAEAVSKELHKAHTIVCPELNRRLNASILDVDYGKLQGKSEATMVSDEERQSSVRDMAQCNAKLCISFMHIHRLRGLATPIPLFRLSESTAQLGNPRFEWLLDKLVRGDSTHLDEVKQYTMRDALVES